MNRYTTNTNEVLSLSRSEHVHDDGWTSFHNETADSPLVSEAWLEEMRTDVDAITWRQEYCGEFVETEDVYLPRDLVEPCIEDGTAQLERVPSASAWLGVDPARSGNDSSVYVSVDAFGNVFDVRSVASESIPDIVERIKALDAEHGYAGVMVDENGLGAGVVDYSAQDLPNIRPVTFSSKSKQDLYQTLKRVLESEGLALPRHDRLIHELTHLEYDFTSNGILRMSHPPGGHDDHADGLALSVYGWQQAEHGGPVRRTREPSSTTPVRKSQ